jgi:uncharacterized protein YbaP (TraB family)
VCNRLLALLAALLLAACQQSAEPARPAIWEVSGPKGEQAWLLGTIHALPRPITLDSPAYARATGSASTLIVEVAALEDDQRTALAFHKLSAVQSAPPVLERIEPALRPQLSTLLTTAKIQPGQFNQAETWAAALSLAQVISARGGDDSSNGADRLVLKAMRGKPLREFEGAERQLAIFDRLPEAEQRDLLALVVRSAADARADTQRLQGAWARGDAAALAALDHQGLLADPELRQALLVERNQAWLTQLEPMLRRGERPLVAVGALHLVGQDGLVAGLEARGFRVTRLQ